MRGKSLQRVNKLSVIGIGYRPLCKRAKELLLGAEVILASGRLLEVFTRYDEYEAVKHRIKVINKVPETIEYIKQRFSQSSLQPIALLASGDPLFFGIGRKIQEEFGKEAVEILPDLSSVQEAFARIHEPWDDAFFISLHGGPDIAKRRKLPYEAGDIPGLLQRHGKIGILTDPENNPVLIAKILESAIRQDPSSPFSLPLKGRGRGGDAFVVPQSVIVMSVCERLGYPDEKITQGTPEEIAAKSFSDPNVVIVQESGVRRDPALAQGTGIKFGLREDEIDHERGLITKDEVRAATLHKLCLPEQGVLWDIGAGSGSVSLEAARLCPGIRVFAIEKEQQRIDTIKANVQKFGVRNVTVIQGSAPDVLEHIPAPDRVFIGGSGGSLDLIIDAVKEKTQAGIVVINAVTLDTLNNAVPALEKAGFSVDVAEVSVSRSRNVAGKLHMSALNPVFIVTGKRS